MSINPDELQSTTEPEPEPAPAPEPEDAGSDHWRTAMLPDSSQRLVYVGPPTGGTDGPDWSATHGPDTLPDGARVLGPSSAP